MKDIDYTQRSFLTVSKAIHVLSKKFDNVAITLKPSYYYDILVELDLVISRVKIIGTTCKIPSGAYQANLRKSGGNQAGKSTNQPFSSKNCDYVYVETPENCYLIPVKHISCTRSITLSMYRDYIIPS